MLLATAKVSVAGVERRHCTIDLFMFCVDIQVQGCVGGALKTPDQSCSDKQVRWVQFSGPPHFGPFWTFFGFFFAKFGFYGPKLLWEASYEIK